MICFAFLFYCLTFDLIVHCTLFDIERYVQLHCALYHVHMYGTMTQCIKCTVYIMHATLGVALIMNKQKSKFPNNSPRCPHLPLLTILHAIFIISSYL